MLCEKLSKFATKQSLDATKKPSSSDSSNGKLFINDNISLKELRNFVDKSMQEESVLEHVGNNDINSYNEEVFLPNDITTFPSSSGRSGQPLEEDAYDDSEDQFEEIHVISSFLNPTKIGDPTFQTLHLHLFSNAGRIDHPLVFGLRLLKTYDGGSLIAQEFHEKFIWTVRFGNDHFGSIMGYVYYVIGDSVISKVYYVKGLGHNLFYVRQFYDSDMKVAFRKHSCYVRDTDSVEIIKGSYGSNLYTISVEDMMKSSPICLLSKTSKNKSWLWHRHLNHLNFGTINDLARKDLVRGLPRLKFEKDHLCFAR
ncbi:integrase, catalytic region, zinc finger, CCHC-type containing protein [Tanacetum coccineum]